jgi:uncharacterized protein (DUF305 family)
MNKKLAYSLVTLLTASAIAAFSITNSVTAKEWNQAQAPSQPNSNPTHQGMEKSTEVDKTFIEMMIPHHQGAVEMAQMAVNQAKNPEVKKLAESIIKDQNREVQQMQTWYKQWYGAQIPTNNMNMQMHHGMGQEMMMVMQQQEMMDKEMMAALQNASNFDRKFLREMTNHHQMALMMAGMVVDSAVRPETRKLAQSVIQSQSAEIEKMQQLSQKIR